MYYERLLASQDKKSVQIEAKTKLSEIEPQQFIHDPYVLEFLNLKNYPALHESTIEQALIDNLQHLRAVCFILVSVMTVLFAA